MILIVDLDGTLLDTWDKFYYCHVKACEAIAAVPGEREFYQDVVRSGGKSFDAAYQSTYWSRKLGRRDRRKYYKRFVEVVESPKALQHDTLIDGTEDFLKQANPVYLATLRRSWAMLMSQLMHLDIQEYFSGIQNAEKAKVKVTWKDKARLVQKHWLDKDDRETWLIGDDEKDILAAQHLGIRSCAVDTGARSADYLKQYAPNRVISSIGDFVRFMK